ncbi:hypothetical protein [Paenibacillus sp. LjRoot56]|uniref:hypothetical protein n=1 Tax=Paenibacillus sp. LjRoot56 TaxID=3342333 RepID=UPI003ECEB85C
MQKSIFYALLSLFLLVAIVYAGYHLFWFLMTERPVPKTRTIVTELKVSNVELFGPATTDLLHTSPYYYAFKAKKDGKPVIIVVDQYFGRSEKKHPLVNHSYIFIYPHPENIQENRIEVSDGQDKYESAAIKQIIFTGGSPTNLIFELEDKKVINTYDWGLHLLKDY